MATKTHKLLLADLKEYLEFNGWKVTFEKKLPNGRCRADIFAKQGKRTLIVEVKMDDGCLSNKRVDGSKSTAYSTTVVYQALGQAIWYSQYADEVWLVVPNHTYRCLINLKTDAINFTRIKILQMEHWL